jgi:hypothetical protein
MESIGILAECRAFFLSDFTLKGKGQLSGSMYGLRYLLGQIPTHRALSLTLVYLHIFKHEWACMETPRQAERERVFNEICLTFCEPFLLR